MLRSLAVLLILGLALRAQPGQAQVGASSRQPLAAYGYAVASGVEDEQTFGKALGGGGGVVLERNRFLALDFRGYAIRAREPIHTYLGELGPRASYRIWRVKPYGEFLGAYGHSGYAFLNPDPQVNGKSKYFVTSGYGLGWGVAFGADLRLTHRIQWRVADVSFNHIYTGPGVSPEIISTGVVVRIF